MNIENIAQEVARETDWKDAAGFLRRCLEKLAEETVEPVARIDEVAMHKDGYRISMASAKSIQVSGSTPKPSTWQRSRRWQRLVRR